MTATLARARINPWLHQLFRQLVLDRAGHLCQRCLRSGRLYITFLTPIESGGAMTLANAMALCRDCRSRRPQQGVTACA